MHRLSILAGILLLSILAACTMLSAGQAAEILDVNSHTGVVDLTPYRNPVIVDHSKIALQAGNDAHATDLEGVGPGPNFYWTYYSLHSSSDVDLSFQFEADHQGFSGSGILAVRPAGAQLYQAFLTDPARPLTIVRGADTDDFQVTIKPGQSLNIVVQSVAPDFTLRILPSAEFASDLGVSAFFRGLVLGIAALVTFGILYTYGYRPNRPTFAGWLFAIMATLFIVFEQGNYPPLPVNPAAIGAFIESLWAAALALCVASFTDARKQSPLGYYLLLGVVGVLLANAAFGLIEPLRAATVARLAFAALVVTGFILTLVWRNSAAAVVDRGLLFWTLFAGWTLFASVSALQTGRNSALSPLLSGLLAAVLMLLALELVRFVFSQGLASRPFITDQSRRSLALASAGHSLWDYEPHLGELEVSDELPRSLGYNPADWPGQARGLLRAILDPLDLKAYELEVEHKSLRPGALIEHDLKLRDAEGRWRWFRLRARTLPSNAIQGGHCIGTMTEVTGLKLAEARQSVDSMLDPVTGIANRNLFKDRLERALSRKPAPPIRVLILEIEKFKTLNESLGQDNGDRLLQSAAARILDSLHSDETAARLSGGQFAILLVEAKGRRDVLTYANEIASALAQPLTLPHYRLDLDTCIGISLPSATGSFADDLLQQANFALLEARHGNKGAIAVYDGDMKDERAAQHLLEADLRHAVTGDEIEVYFQPICDLESGIIAGYEALARWRHPRLGLLAPQEFIDMAERIGLIGEIGELVLSGAARQLGIWQRVARQGSSFFVSVNVSVTHLLQDGFLQHVQTLVERESLLPASFKIEITESVIMRQPERVMQIMAQLHDIGVGLACDDFGTGFSSLASLRDLPFDTLKLDRSFIAPDVLDERSTLIISSIADMAHDLGMLIVAEGIERQEQIDVLSELGCDLGQGYLIGRAEPAKEISEKLIVMPRYAAPTPHVPAPPRPVDVEGFKRREKPVPGSLPMAPRLQVAREPEPVADPDIEPEELPSLFSLPAEPAVEKPAKPARRQPVKSRKRSSGSQTVTS